MTIRTLIPILIFSWLFTPQAYSASFDCTKASTTVENMICASPRLSDLDSQLGREYAKALKSACNKEKLIYDQNIWLRIRDASTREHSLIEKYTKKIEFYAVRNADQTSFFEIVHPSLGVYKFSLTPKGCRSFNYHSSQRYTLTATNDQEKQVVSLELTSSVDPKNIMYFNDMDGDGYKDLYITEGYAAGPYPFITYYRFNSKTGAFEMDDDFPGIAGLASSAEKPGCIYVDGKDGDYFVAKFCFDRESQTWNRLEACYLSQNRECYQQLTNNIRELNKKRSMKK